MYEYTDRDSRIGIDPSFLEFLMAVNSPRDSNERSFVTLRLSHPSNDPTPRATTEERTASTASSCFEKLKSCLLLVYRKIVAWITTASSWITWLFFRVVGFFHQKLAARLEVSYLYLVNLLTQRRAQSLERDVSRLEEQHRIDQENLSLSTERERALQSTIAERDQTIALQTTRIDLLETQLESVRGQLETSEANQRRLQDQIERIQTVLSSSEDGVSMTPEDLLSQIRDCFAIDRS